MRTYQPETRQECIDRLVEEYGPKHAKLMAAGQECLTLNQFRICLEESIAKTGKVRLLKNPPSFRDRPHGSIFLRLYKWHGSNGDLHGYFFAREDCLWIERINRRRAVDRVGVAAWVPETFPTFEAFDTTAITARGKSTAAQAWQNALGRNF